MKPQPQLTIGKSNYVNYVDIVKEDTVRPVANISLNSVLEGAISKLTSSMETFMLNMQNTIQTLVQTINTLMNIVAKRMN